MVDYKINQNYLSLRKGQRVDDRYLGIYLRNNSGLWRNYCRKSNEPTESSHIGMNEYDYPNHNKIVSRFLEDLVEIGVIEKIPSKKRGRKNGMH